MLALSHDPIWTYPRPWRTGITDSIWRFCFGFMQEAARSTYFALANIAPPLIVHRRLVGLLLGDLRPSFGP